MSDLTATNCGCNNNNSRGIFGGNSWLWILLILFCLGNDDDGCGSGRSGFGLFNNDGNSSCCNTLVWLLILSSCFFN